MKEKIIQIIPADGWFVRFFAPKEVEAAFTYHPLVCFALVENAYEKRRVLGMIALHDDGEIVLVDDNDGDGSDESFAGIVKEGTFDPGPST